MVTNITRENWMWNSCKPSKQL